MQILKTGSNGSDVVTLQKALNKYFSAKYGSKNTIKLKEDGDFGPGTDKAIKQFQSESNLLADGVVGDKTWTKLNSALTSAPVPTPPPPVSPTSTSSINFSPEEKAKFTKITAIVIDKLEGGYYHPNMNSATGKLKKHYPALDSSGETMFGIDRLNGKGSLANNPAWNKFWGMIDTAGASTAWDYNYTGGTLKDELTQLTIEIMAPHFVKLSNSYLKNNWKIVFSDNRLIFHFAYASWNGAGWFKKFANDIDKAIKSGNSNLDFLAQVALDSRLKEGLKEGSPPNSLIVQTGKKIKVIFETLK